MTWVTWAAECSRGSRIPCEGAHEHAPRVGWILDGMSTTERPRILVVGGGYVGLYAARRILKKMRYGEATVTVVDPRSYMTYQPFLPEAARRQHLASACRRPAATRAAQGRGSHRPCHDHRSGPQGRHGRAARRRGLRAALRLPGHRDGRGLPHLPDPRPRRAGHRHEGHRGVHRSAQPRPRAAGQGRLDDRRGRPPQGADVRLRGRRVRRLRRPSARSRTWLATRRSTTRA